MVAADTLHHHAAEYHRKTPLGAFGRSVVRTIYQIDMTQRSTYRLDIVPSILYHMHCLLRLTYIFNNIRHMHVCDWTSNAFFLRYHVRLRYNITLFYH
jgi:hypothetical protein